MICQKCSGLLRLDVDDHVYAAVCCNCGWRAYAPFKPFVLSVDRLEQAKHCRNCGMGRVVTNKSLCGKCLGARIKQGQLTGKRPYVRREATASPDMP